jgi:hypothetical protein
MMIVMTRLLAATSKNTELLSEETRHAQHTTQLLKQTGGKHAIHEMLLTRRRRYILWLGKCVCVCWKVRLLFARRRRRRLCASLSTRSNSPPPPTLVIMRCSNRSTIRNPPTHTARHTGGGDRTWGSEVRLCVRACDGCCFDRPRVAISSSSGTIDNALDAGVHPAMGQPAAASTSPSSRTGLEALLL